MNLQLGKKIIDNLVKEDNEETDTLEWETAAAMLKNKKKIDFL